jgi:hypothetical protein
VVAISADRGRAYTYLQHGLLPHNTSSSCKYCNVACPSDCDAILDVPVLSETFVGALLIQRESKQLFRHGRVVMQRLHIAETPSLLCLYCRPSDQGMNTTAFSVIQAI